MCFKSKSEEINSLLTYVVGGEKGVRLASPQMICL